jgi:hypothetical protein
MALSQSHHHMHCYTAIPVHIIGNTAVVIATWLLLHHRWGFGYVYRYTYTWLCAPSCIAWGQLQLWLLLWLWPWIWRYIWVQQWHKAWLWTLVAMIAIASSGHASIHWHGSAHKKRFMPITVTIAMLVVLIVTRAVAVALVWLWFSQQLCPDWLWVCR